MRNSTKTIVYVDGFNLYYGALRGTDFKWLDLGALCAKLLPSSQITKIYYFTAKVSGTTDDPGKPSRQLVYVRALRTNPVIEVVDGYFSIEKQIYQRADGGGPVEVIRTKEKKSDVNLASQLLWDAHCDAFQTAVVISGDSDFVTPVRLIKERFRKQIGILDPQREPTPNSQLSRAGTFYKPIRAGAIRDSQFPDQLRDQAGEFWKPGEWFSGGTN